jgi:hypothetical protein
MTESKATDLSKPQVLSNGFPTRIDQKSGGIYVVADYILKGVLVSTTNTLPQLW